MLHKIRLHGPWHLLPLAASSSTSDLAAATTDLGLGSLTRIRVPGSVDDSQGGTGDSSEWLLIRPFRLPTGLSQAHQLWLDVDSGAAIHEIWLNGQRLPAVPGEENRWPILVEQLHAQNRLGVRLACGEQNKTSLAHVVLVIDDRG